MEFSNRVYEKLSKLSDSQIASLVGELSAQHDMLNSIIQSISTGLITVNKEFRILQINKAAERLIPFNIFPSDVKDDNARIFELINDTEISEFIKECLENNKSNISEQFTLQTSGGTIRFIEISISALVQNDEITGSIIAIDDITEKKNQEILLHRTEKLAGLTNIAANVAHEIKNPLGAISIHIQLLQKAIRKKRESDGLLPDEKYTENYLDVVNLEIDRLNKIVVDFLMAVRPIKAEFSLVRPDKIVNELIGFITPEFSEKKIKIVTDLCDSCPKLLIDEKLFREIIVNLAQNSLAAIEEKFSGRKKSNAFEEVVYGRIEIKTCVKDDKYYLSFKDNGAGMTEEVKARVFEPYYTTKVNGTGLGMAMVYKIIKEFSGDISFTSEAGEGTEFILTLPVPQITQKLLTNGN